MKLKEVFTPGGQPSVTYVGREHLDLENAVKRAMNVGYTLNVVTGPTKSGKTVLCTRVLESAGKYVLVEGGQVRTESDFWGHMAFQLNLGQTATKSKTDTSTLTGGGGAIFSVPGFLQVRGDGSGTTGEQHTASMTYSTVPVLAVTQALLESGTAVLVDDFHYIPTDVQKAIIQALKGPVYKGLSVILLAVPHRAFDPITVEDELQGRFVHIAIPPWTMDDLLLIPQRGFQALNVTLPSAAQRRICEESFGNPLLVQEVCSNLCGTAGIWETAAVSTPIDPALLDATFSAVASSKGFPKYRKLKDGPQARKARQPRSLRNGETADIYECLLLALGRLGPKSRNTYDEIRAALRELLEESQMPAKHEVTAALTHMSKIAQTLEGEPPLEFVRDEDALVITDPFLLFYMKWEKEKVAPGAVG